MKSSTSLRCEQMLSRLWYESYPRRLMCNGLGHLIGKKVPISRFYSCSPWRHNVLYQRPRSSRHLDNNVASLILFHFDLTNVIISKYLYFADIFRLLMSFIIICYYIFKLYTLFNYWYDVDTMLSRNFICIMFDDYFLSLINITNR